MLHKHVRREHFTAMMLANGWTRPLAGSAENTTTAKRAADLSPCEQEKRRAAEKRVFPELTF